MQIEMVKSESQWVGEDGIVGNIQKVEMVFFKKWDKNIKEKNKFVITDDKTQLRVSIQDVDENIKYFEPRDFGLSQNYLIGKFTSDSDNWIGKEIEIKRQDNPKTGKQGNYIVGSL
jgi:hypothetical protein